MLNDTSFKSYWVGTVHAEVYKHQYPRNFELCAFFMPTLVVLAQNQWFTHRPEVKIYITTNYSVNSVNI